MRRDGPILISLYYDDVRFVVANIRGDMRLRAPSSGTVGGGGKYGTSFVEGFG